MTDPDAQYQAALLALLDTERRHLVAALNANTLAREAVEADQGR